MKKAFPGIKTLFFFTCIFLAVSSFVSAQASNDSDFSLYTDSLVSLTKNILISFDLFEEGRILYEKSDYIHARQKFKKSLEYDPGNTKADEYLNLCNKKYLSQKKYPGKKHSADGPQGIEMNFLNDLEQRINQLEIGTATKTMVEHKKEEVKVQQKETVLPDNTDTDVKKQITERNTKKAEKLMAKGDSYYAEEQYEKAYKYYKKAFTLLNE